jgi:hypothetical protein
MRHALLAFAVFSMFLTLGCGKTWVDDDKNFERSFGFEKPPSIQVVHSYYRENINVLGTKHKSYFIAFRSLDGKFDPSKMEMNEEPGTRSRFGCAPNPPSWFVPKSPDRYQMWVSKDWAGVRAFRDKDDGTIYQCAGEGGS